MGVAGEERGVIVDQWEVMKQKEKCVACCDSLSANRMPNYFILPKYQTN